MRLHRSPRTMTAPAWILLQITMVGVFVLCGAGVAAGEPRSVMDLTPPRFEVFGVKDGLSDEIYSTVGKDAQGFIWAGSASGLYRFDGYGWTHHPVHGAASLVRDMVSDADGQLWTVFEREGLARLNQGRWELHNDSAFIHRFSSTRKGTGETQIWASQREGARRLVKGQWQPDPASSRLDPAMNIAIARTERLFGEPRLWLARSQAGLWFRSADDPNADWQPFDLGNDDSALFTDLVSSTSDGHEELWILTYGSGIIRLRSDGGRRHWRKSDGALPSEAVYSGVVTYDRDERRSLWVASRGGLLRFFDESLQVFDRSDGLPSNAVRGIKRFRGLDGSDVLWLATEGGMVRARLAASAWRTITRLGASENGVFGVFVEPDGYGGDRIVAGSAKEGIALLDQGRWRRFSAESGHLPDNNVRALWRFAPSDGPVIRLASLEQGWLYQFDDALEFRPIKVPWQIGGNRGATAATLRHGPTGTEVWIAAPDGSIHRLNEDRLQTVHTPSAMIGTIHYLIEQRDQNNAYHVWAATDQGLFRVDEHRIERVDVDPIRSERSYRHLTIIERAGRQELWASTLRHGVVRLDVSNPLKPVALTDAIPAPPDPTIYSVSADQNGRVYICTNNGVQQLRPQDDGGYSERVFRRREGLVHDECNSRSQWIDEHDRFWVGTLAGLSMYDPALQSSASPQRQAAPLRLTEIRIDDQPLAMPAQGELTLPPGTRTFSARFSLLTGHREQDNVYRATLVGSESSDVEWSQQPLRLWARPGPGRHLLRIEARDFSGLPADPLELNVTVLPAWYERGPVRIGLVVATLLLLVSLVHFYNRALRRRQQELEALVGQRTDDLARANRQLTEFSYSDPLTGIANRRRLDEGGREVIAQAREKKWSLSLILLDLDDFKEFNDEHGHLAGDLALQFVALELKAQLRPADLVARFGGEEFACLLTATDLDEARQVAERMRNRISDASQRVLAQRYRPLTISAGIARLEPGDTKLEDLIERADQALYQAKAAGRNQVMTASAKDE